MAVEYAGGRIVKKAGADLTGKKYYGGKIDGNGAVVVAAAGDAKFIIIEEGKAGESVTIQYANETKMVAGEAIGAFAYGTSDANGKLVATGVGKDSLVLTLEAATAAKQIVPVVIVHKAAPVITELALNDLTDVVLTGAADGDLLKYDAATQKFVNEKAALTELSDVVITEPADTQALKYNTASTKWKNAADAIA